MKTFLYIGGFNLDDIALKQFSLRWLNPVALVARAFPRNQICHTQFFTANVSSMPGNPDQPTRQQFYWRALRTLPEMEIILRKPVGVLNPQRISGPDSRKPRKSAGLQHAASFYQNSLTWAQLAAAQFPATLTDKAGTFTKPQSW